ncbi:MAG: HigA family addiction module antitoxin [Planctomycetaceae bacterium]
MAANGSVAAKLFPPGEFIREEIEARGWTQGDLAKIMDRPIQAVNEIISGKRSITVETAQALGAAFGTGPEVWLNLESAWRLHQERTDTTDIARRSRLYSIAPVKELVRRGWIEDAENLDDLERQVLDFMGMKSADATPSFEAVKSTRPIDVAWLRRAKMLAQGIRAKPYHRSQFVKKMSEIRDLVANEARVKEVPRFLAEIGVKLVLIEHLPGMQLEAATFWLGKSPVVAISMRINDAERFRYLLSDALGCIERGLSAGFMIGAVGHPQQQA